jgi:hypothetical protein
VVEERIRCGITRVLSGHWALNRRASFKGWRLGSMGPTGFILFIFFFFKLKKYISWTHVGIAIGLHCNDMLHGF